MTYLGTRPPTLDEWNKYELHHRARLGQLDIESGEGEVRAYMWQQNGGWTLNRFLDRMSKVDKSLYCFELSPTEFMKRSGKVSVKETDRPEISELRSLAVEKIEKMYKIA